MYTVLLVDSARMNTKSEHDRCKSAVLYSWVIVDDDFN